MEDHEPYQIRFNHPPDFIVDYRILTEAEGGRRTPVYQGIRWDLWYKVPELTGNHLWMVWPEFLDEAGSVIIQRDTPVAVTGRAALWIVSESMRPFHQQRIDVGMLGFAREGARNVATYQVTELVGLMTNPVA